MVIAADFLLGTRRAIEFAEFAGSAGADIIMTLPPNWGSSGTPQTLAEHYHAVSQHLPTMIVTNIFIDQGADFGLETIKLTLDRSENVVAIKDDMCGTFAGRLALLAYDRCALVAGGNQGSHINMWPYGVDGYLSMFMSFKPEIEHRYWRAVEARDMESMRSVYRDYEVPIFDFMRKLPGEFDAAIHGTLELFGVSKRWRRKPYYSLNDQEMESLADLYRGLGLLPE
jgi:dihydrodipicolinate synthase/N-acetylneuraminate lyase